MLFKLEDLILGMNNISDLNAISGLRNLKVLNLADNKVQDTAPLAGLISLETLSLWKNQVKSGIPNLTGLTNLTDLNLEWNHAIPCADLDALINAMPQGTIEPPWECLEETL